MKKPRRKGVKVVQHNGYKHVLRRPGIGWFDCDHDMLCAYHGRTRKEAIRLRAELCVNL